MEARLRKVVEICEQQYGFMPRKSTTDAIFALRILIEKYRDGQRELHCVFVDLENVYDRVPREELWYCMRKSGIAEKYVRVVQDMYERSRTVVRCAVGQKEEFKVEVGLHKGSALSPFLFAIVIDQLSEEVRQESRGVNQGEGVQDSGETGHAVWFRDSVTEEETGVRARDFDYMSQGGVIGHQGKIHPGCSANPSQVGCELEEKERFWSELDEVMESIPTGERVVIGADFNGHVGEGNRGDEEVMGKFGVKKRNLEGQMVVDFAKRKDMAVDSIQRKRLAKKKWDMDRTAENRQEYKELQRRVKREVSKAKQKAYDELYTRFDTREGEKDLYRLARQRDQDGKDVQQVRVIKDRDGRVFTSEESVQRRWKKYFEELMNEENEREKRVEGVNSVEQKVDKIRKDEVRKALKKMKSGKAVGPDDIPVKFWTEAWRQQLMSILSKPLGCCIIRAYFPLCMNIEDGGHFNAKHHMAQTNSYEPLTNTLMDENLPTQGVSDHISAARHVDTRYNGVHVYGPESSVSPNAGGQERSLQKRCSKLVLKLVKTWPEGAISALQDCFECTDWDMFREVATKGNTTDLEEYTSSVTSYTSKCIDDVTISKSITTRSNQKLWMTAKVHALLKSRDSA
ncbi:hypothetical protein QTP70_033856 [Hemibagrus guttatus]|uniref:Reverse transcriptase domain-containing protein n=1 Tax=Hemibagrus guttatus TaxID=175788 RepID=A0AAE0PRQ8_9TELE|nr:hypothetical protein QTP70_033856 [Hemibagrus guttatus]